MLRLLSVLANGLHSPSQVSAKTDTGNVADRPVLAEEFSGFSAMGKAGNGNEETPGAWYIGQTPENLQPDTPVLLFVPGLNSVAQVFWEDNDMYQTAYQAGYQTAFVQLHDAGGENADMRNNGSLLASKIQEISNHFGGKDITIVAHSKGGVDSQTALTYYGASEYVDNVITLSSPHHGSQLADLAYSSGAGWLADLIGMQGEGTASMQMAYMENFRSMTDSNPDAYRNNYFTLGGTDWGSMFSSNWFGGVYLSGYGPNDGVVTAASSNLPGGIELAIGEWDHSTVRTGMTFSVFESFLAGEHLVDSDDFSIADHQSEAIPPVSNHWVHGGPLGNKEALMVDVEENVENLTLNLLTAEPISKFKITNSSGKKKQANVQQTRLKEGIFKGAYSYTMTIDKPESGKWQLEMRSSKNDNAYLLVANFKTDTYLQTNVAQNFITQDDLYHINMDGDLFDEDTLTATYHVTETGNPQHEKQWTVKGNSNLSQKLNLKKPDTVYNVTVDIAGITNEGNPFKRTIVDSVYAK